MAHLPRVSMLGLLVLLSGSINAQTPGCVAAEHHRFDFWLGSWDVYLADGTLAGHNEIVSEEGGCVLVERWTSIQGGTGMSQNFYDVAAGKWRQLWISPGTQIDVRGDAGTNEIALEGTISYITSGETFPFRGRWTLLDDGRVRQFFEEAREAGTWKEWFEGFYVPVTGSGHAE